MDATSELFLKSEGRGGGPNDPLTSFDDIFKDLYPWNELAPKDSKEHPLYDVLFKFNQQETPG